VSLAEGEVLNFRYRTVVFTGGHEEADIAGWREDLNSNRPPVAPGNNIPLAPPSKGAGPLGPGDGNAPFTALPGDWGKGDIDFGGGVWQHRPQTRLATAL
ncbi:MAG: hypothetical protein R6W89_00665, partial [Candidatus Hydrogenedentota bacterium]